MRNWYSTLSKDERHTFWACYGGWTLDALDAQMLPLVLPALIAQWHFGRTVAGSIVGAALACSAIGGWLGGALADRYGRVRMLQVTLGCFSLFSLLAALAQSPGQLVLFKALQGLGFGGEWAVGSVLVAEVLRPEHRGKSLGIIQSGWAVGWGLSVLLFTACSAMLPQAICWRVLFALGVLPALLVLYIQRSIPEPLRSHTSEEGNVSAGRPGTPRPAIFNLVSIFSPGTLRVTLIGALLGLGAHGGYYALTTWLPTYLMVERHISVATTGGYLGVIIVSFGLGCFGAAYLLDRIGRRHTILLFALGSIATISFYLLLSTSTTEMFYLGFPLGFCSAGIPASLGALFSELFPTGMRGTGVGFCYNFGRIASAGFPALVGALSSEIGLRRAIGVDAILGYGIVAAAVLALPETRRRVLEEERQAVTPGAI
jgi:MFS family permease